MNWFKNRTGHTKISEDALDLGVYFENTLKSIDAVRPFIKSYRKFLEAGSSRPLPVLGPSSDGILEENPALKCLTRSQEILCIEERTFRSNCVEDFQRVLRNWEAACDSVMQKKKDVSRAIADLKKANEKVRNSRDYDATSGITNSQTYCEHLKGELRSEIANYRLREKEFQTAMKIFVDKQVEFLRSCAEKTGQNARSISQTPSYFGTSLRHHLNQAGYSIVLLKCISYLCQTKGFSQEGIFRVPGLTSGITILRDSLNRNNADDSVFEYCGTYVVADVLKQYLRELQEPLLSADFVQNWTSSRPSAEEVVVLMKNYLPAENRKNLLLVLHFLSKVCAAESTSKMTPENVIVTLGMVFYPEGDLQRVCKILLHLLALGNAIYGGENLDAVIKSAATTSTTSTGGPTVPIRTYSHANGSDLAMKPRAPAPPSRTSQKISYFNTSQRSGAPGSVPNEYETVNVHNLPSETSVPVEPRTVLAEAQPAATESKLESEEPQVKEGAEPAAEERPPSHGSSDGGKPSSFGGVDGGGDSRSGRSSTDVDVGEYENIKTGCPKPGEEGAVGGVEENAVGGEPREGKLSRVSSTSFTMAAVNGSGKESGKTSVCSSETHESMQMKNAMDLRRSVSSTSENVQASGGGEDAPKESVKLTMERSTPPPRPPYVPKK